MGQHVRAERLARGWTLAEMAVRCRVSAGTLSKVENGRMGLGTETLLRIVEGLGIPVTSLLEDDAGPRVRARRSVTAERSARRFAIPGYDLYYYASDTPRKRLVPMLIRVNARSLEDAGGLRFHKGEEVYYVVSGAAVLHTGDDAPRTLRAGECVFMDGRTPHAFTAWKGGAVIFSVNEGHRVYSAADGTLYDVEVLARERSRLQRGTGRARANHVPGLQAIPSQRSGRRTVQTPRRRRGNRRPND